MIGTIEMTSGKHHRRLLIITGSGSYTADSLEELEREFHKAVDGYLGMLEKYCR